ncbi:IclR family transcriptional regulator [Kerstersia similis]
MPVFPAPYAVYPCRTPCANSLPTGRIASIMSTTDPAPRALASQTLFRGLDIIDAVADGCITVQAIAARTGVSFSTTHRLASALVQARYLHFEPRRGYRLGNRLLELGFAAYRESTLTSCARPHLERLAEETQDTVHLASLDGNGIIYLDKIGGQRPVQVNTRIGGRKPICGTGVGKSLILDETPEQWLQRYEHDAVRGDIQIPRDAWMEMMARYAQGGYSMDLEENAAGIRCVAAPVRDISNRIIAAISVTGTAPYTDEARMRALIPVVQLAARQISEALGSQV